MNSKEKKINKIQLRERKTKTKNPNCTADSVVSGHQQQDDLAALVVAQECYLLLCRFSCITVACLRGFLVFSSFLTIFPGAFSQLLYKNLNYFGYSFYRQKQRIINQFFEQYFKVNLYLFSIKSIRTLTPSKHFTFLTKEKQWSQTSSNLHSNNSKIE